MNHLPFLLLCLSLSLPAMAGDPQPFRSATQKWGYKDDQGKTVVPPKYAFEAHPFSCGVAIVRNAGLTGYGVIDATGREIVPPQYSVADDYVNGLARVCTGARDVFGNGGKWGFIDTRGKVVIPLQYDRINGNFEGDSYAIVTLNAKEMVIDKTGKEIHIDSCDELQGNFYRSNLAQATKAGKWGMVDKKGNVRIPFEYDMLYPVSDGMIAVKKGDLWGFLDENNKMVIQPRFNSGSAFTNGVAIIYAASGKVGCIDKTGKTTIPFEYDSLYPQSKLPMPLMVAKKNDKVGYINPLTGAVVVPLKYDSVNDFKEGLAVVELHKKFGFMNPDGKEVVTPMYDYASSLCEGLAYVKSGNKNGYIDKTGKLVIPMKFLSADEFQGGVAQVSLDGKNYQFIDKKGNVVTE